MWKIGNVEIKNRIVFAPMAGISNESYRQIIKSMGAGLIYSEMVSDKGIVYNSKKTLDLLKINEYERPISIQIFGSDIDSFVKAAKYVNDNIKPDILDINMGCPVPKVALKSQAGSGLLKNPQKIFEIVSEIVKNVDIPVSVKIRSGWDKNSINCVEVAKLIEKAGASAIAIHPRTREQGYSGKSDWNLIKQVKQAVNIPVIGNGDIQTIYDAKKMIDETGCDAVMIGRAALSNPFIFKELDYYFKTGKKLEKISDSEKLDLALKHFNYLLEIKPEKVAVLEMRTIMANYIKGIPGSTKIKQSIFACKTKEELVKILEEYRKTL